MTPVFVDTLYWIALFNPRDQWHQHAVAAKARVVNRALVTTHEVFVEVLNALAGAGREARQLGVQVFMDALADANVELVEQSPESFRAGLELYQRRQDKSYSLTDCISMQAMRERGLREVLTHDHHFEQEGFVALLRQP